MAKPVASTRHNMSVLVLFVQGEVTSSPRKLGEGLGHVICDATPDIPGLEGAQLQRCDDTEIVQTAPESNPEVWVVFRTCPDHVSRCENNLKLQDGVADKTSAA